MPLFARAICAKLRRKFGDGAQNARQDKD